jgi:hypothetical protein
VAGGGAGRRFRRHVVVVARQAVEAGPSLVCCRGLPVKLGHGGTIYMRGCASAGFRIVRAESEPPWTRARDIFVTARGATCRHVPKRRD